MSTSLLRPRSHWEPTPNLPAGTAVEALVVSAAYRAVVPEIRADIKAGRNSSRVGRAFRELEQRDSLFPPLGRRARARGIRVLTGIESQIGGVL